MTSPTTEGMIRRLTNRAPRAWYTYKLRDDYGVVISEFDVDFEYEISDDDGTADPYIDVTSITCEALQRNMLGMTGWRRFLAMDMLEQIQSDAEFCAGLLEGTDEGEAAEYRHSSDIRGLRSWHQSVVTGARL